MSKDLIVTTMDLKQNYEILGMVYFQINSGGFLKSSPWQIHLKKYADAFEAMKKSGTMGTDRTWSWNETDLEKAFYISTEELKERAKTLGADAIIGLREDTDWPMDGGNFSMQMYGTAVRFAKK